MRHINGVSVSNTNLALGQNGNFRLGDFITPQAMANMGYRADTADTAFFLRQLTYIYQQTYDIKYPELKARSFIPVDNRVNPGADSYIWRQFDRLGQAKVVQNYADDFPNAEAIGREYQGRIVSLGASYQYTLQDLRAASMAGLPLETRKAEAARKAVEYLVEHLAAVGMDGTVGADNTNTNDTTPIYGLCNFPNIQSSNTTNNWTGGATVAQILGDVNTASKKIFDNTKGIHMPDTMLLPTSVYSFLATQQRSITFTDDTLIQYILKSSPWLKSIECWPWLDTAGTSAASSFVTTGFPRVILYKKDPEILQMVVPQEFEQLPPQMIGMSFKVPCHMRYGGVTIRYPKAVCYMDGTTG